ncbi:MAG: hypothetical protein HGA75_17665 [Thiobacillus sp.]|nr:hypothetical protein [Thiobacillus sp.]
MGLVRRYVFNSWPILLFALLFWGCAGSGTAPVAVSKGIIFSAAERATIERYYGDARRAPAKPAPSQFKAGDKLVSGLRPQHLPTDLAARLPDLPAGYTRLVLGSDVLLVNRDSHDILDVIPAVAY